MACYIQMQLFITDTLETSINVANPKERSNFAELLLSWYGVQARVLPWRVPPSQSSDTRADPYLVWLSEIMLQQTQVVTVRQYFLDFVRRWPTVEELSQAPLEDVLKAWAGLGYYSRARNLKKCADLIANKHGGQFPETADELKKLPGIGEYTSAAISAIAFGRPAIVVDGNIERIVSRTLAIQTAFPKAKAEVRAFLATVADEMRPGDFAQAMMDLGAMVCTPRSPNCTDCPLESSCLARQAGNPESFPVKNTKPSKPVRKGAAFVLQNSRGDVFLCKREAKGLLAGMTQVPTTNWSSRQDGATSACAAPLQAEWEPVGQVRHTFTHFHLELTVWQAIHDGMPTIEGWWCPRTQIPGEALPRVMQKVIAKAAN